MTALELRLPGNRWIAIPATLRDQALVTLWIFITFRRFQYDTVLLYALALYFAYAFVMRFERTLPVTMRGAVLLLFPAWWLLSVIWAVDPFTAFKSGLQLVLTMIISLYAAAMLRPRQIMLAVFAAAGLIGIMNLVYPVLFDTLPTRGAFKSKNAMGGSAVILFITSLALFLDSGLSRGVRFVGVVFAGIAAILALASASATAVLLALGGGAVLMAGAMLVGDSSIFRLERLAAVSLVAGLMLAMAAAVLAWSQVDVVTATLHYFNKDTTLTGRTELWAHAERQIAAHPLLGVGEGGFWRPYYDSSLIRKIYADFHKEASAVFNFHNSFYEIAVHQGLVGLGLAVLALLWAVAHLTRAVLLRGGMPTVFFFTLAMVIVVRATTESEFFKPFALSHMLLWIGTLRCIADRENRSELLEGERNLSSPTT